MPLTIRPRCLVGAGAAVVAAAAGTFVPLPSPAGASLAFTASSAASGLRVSETIPGSPGAETLVDGGGPTAQTLLSSGATSTSFASFPYPGETAVAFPGQLAGLAPELPRLPDYPFYVRADQTDPEPARVETPVATLEAKSAASEATSRAASGAGSADAGAVVGHLAAAARSVSEEQSVTATATGSASGVVIGPLRIAAITSTATVVLDGTGALRRTSRLRVDGLAVDGQGLAVQDGEIVLAATRVPLPDTSPVREALASAGLDIEYVAAEETATGLVADGFTVRRTQESPNGPVTVRFAFGQALASIDGSVAPGLEIPALDAVEGTGPFAGDAPPPAVGATPSTAAPDVLTLLAPSNLTGLERGAAAAPAGLTGSVPETLLSLDSAGPQPGSDEVVASAPVDGASALPAAAFFDTATSYLAIAFAGATAIAFALLVSLMGVRFGWKH